MFSTFSPRAFTMLLAGVAFAVNSSAASPKPADADSAWQGRIQVLIVDHPQPGTSGRRLFLQTPRETLELETAGDGSLRAGQQVEVRGRSSGNRLVVSQVQPADSQPAAPTCSSIGEQKVVVILASYPSKALLSSVTPDLMRASFFGTGPTLDTFLRESSFGQSWVTGDVLGPFVLDADYFDQPLAARDAALRAAAGSADLTQYSRIFVVMPQGETGMDSGGMALLGCGQISSPQGVLNASSMWLGAESMVTQGDVAATASHELGHGFGLEHARFADYGADTLGPAGQPSAPWDSIHEYGDSFSNMGRQSAQWGAPQKTLLGWLQPDTNVQTVTSNGTFTLPPYEQTGGVQALKVSRGTGADDWLWLEYRQPQGTFDATLPTAAFAGALVHYADPALTATLSGVDPSTYTNLLNFHPAVGFVSDPTLHPGETWNDPYGNLSLTVNSASVAGLSVSVAYAPAPVCPGSADAAQPIASTGGSGAVAVTAASTCSWQAAASVPWISLGSASAGTGNGSVSFTVAANPNISPRWGRITVGDAFAIITQPGSSGWMALSPQAASAPAMGVTAEFAVAASAPDLAWTMGTNVPWITDIECSCFTLVGSATVRYVVAANTGPARTGVINAGGIAFTVTQQAAARPPENVVWDQLTPPDAPVARMSMAMAQFGRSGSAIFYGGNWNMTLFADTWLWNGNAWSQLQPANNPGMRTQHAMAYDEARGQIVLFGGMAGATPVADNQTWVWDGTNWRQMQPAMSPPARYGHAMAYDSALQEVVMFGGYGEYGEMNDTWIWDGANWTQATSVSAPPSRSGHSMAYDEAHGVVVMFGGFLSQPVPTWFSDTWVWDGLSWQQKLSATPPAARFGHLLAYHPGLHAVVMIGGYGGKDVTDTSWNYDFRKETWIWNGGEWLQQFPEVQPGPAWTMGASWDENKQALTVQLGDDLTCVSRGPKTFLLEGQGGPVRNHVNNKPSARAQVAR